eukprot:9440821-Lingulodinium_polyedra.AAC.1
MLLQWRRLFTGADAETGNIVFRCHACCSNYLWSLGTNPTPMLVVHGTAGTVREDCSLWAQ